MTLVSWTYRFVLCTARTSVDAGRVPAGRWRKCLTSYPASDCIGAF